MEIPKFFDTFNLHDSVVKNVIYSAEEKRLEVQIELCNYDQADFREGEPEMLSGSLIFSDVAEYVSDSALNDLVWGDHFDGDISTYGHIPERDKADLQAVGLDIYCDNYKTRAHFLLILTFLASDAEWWPS